MLNLIYWKQLNSTKGEVLSKMRKIKVLTITEINKVNWNMLFHEIEMSIKKNLPVFIGSSKQIKEFMKLK